MKMWAAVWNQFLINPLLQYETIKPVFQGMNPLNFNSRDPPVKEADVEWMVSCGNSRRKQNLMFGPQCVKLHTDTCNILIMQLSSIFYQLQVSRSCARVLMIYEKNKFKYTRLNFAAPRLCCFEKPSICTQLHFSAIRSSPCILKFYCLMSFAH